MGTELSKQDKGESIGSAAEASTATTQLVAAKWHAWLQDAEGLYLRGRFRAYQEALKKSTPPLPSDPMAAALLKAVARANAAIGRHAEESLLASARQDEAGGTGTGAGVGGNDDISERTREESLPSLEEALRDAVDVAIRASSSSRSFGPSSPAPTGAKAGAAAGAGPTAWRQSCAVLAAAAEDVAVQIACTVMAARLARGEPTKALSVGLSLLASRRATVAAAGGGGGPGRKDSGRVGRGSDEAEEKERWQAEEEAAEEAARDVFFGVDMLREAFGSALKGPGAGGRKLPLQEAAPRLLHLLRLSWLLAVANLALGRAAAAARLVNTAEHAYGARPSAWRKASLLLATRPPGGASTAYATAPPGSRGQASSVHGDVGGGSGARSGRGGGAGLLGRDPALAMCRFLRGLALLAQGDLEAAAGRLGESLDLDPRGRHSAVCLAHISCFASGASSNAGDRETPTPATESTPCPPPRRRRWRPSDERTREVLRLLELGSSADFESVEERRLLLAGGAAGGAAATGKNTVMKDGVGGGGSGADDGVGRGWRAFEEEGGGGVEAWILLGCVARARGDGGGAVSMFRRALALDPDCLEAVYGVARVLQEAGDHTASRELLLFLGERSQELLRNGPSAAAATATNKDRGSRSPHERLLRFPLDNGGRAPGGVVQDDDRSWGGVGATSVAAATVLPAAPAEVMWRVARASMGVKDWATATLALRGLASEEARAAVQPTEAVQRYFASFAKGRDSCSASPGPGRARVLRALAFCQVQRGLYRDALETVDEVLGVGGGGSGGAGEGDDAATLMLRADALLCLEEGEAVVEASLDRAVQLLNRRQIDMSLPPPTSLSSSSSTCPPPIQKTTAAAAAVEAATAEAAAAWPTTTPQPPGKRRRPAPQETPRGEAAAAATAISPPPHVDVAADRSENGASNNHNNVDGKPRDHRAVDRDRRLARSAAFNNRAVLLIAAGRGEEACWLLRACLLLLPEEPRPVFNLALALWRLGRRRAACVHWLKARNWLGDDGGGGDGGGGRGSVEGFTRLLDAARRRKASLKSEAAEKRKKKGGGHGFSSSSSLTPASHVTEGQGDPLSLPPIQLCLLDIRCLTWWLDHNLGEEMDAPLLPDPGSGGVRLMLR
eukprot:g7988.t1